MTNVPPYSASASLFNIFRSKNQELMQTFFLSFKTAFKTEVLDKKNFQGSITIKGEKYQIQDLDSARDQGCEIASRTTFKKQDSPSELLLTPENTALPLKRVKVIFDRDNGFTMIFHFNEPGSDKIDRVTLPFEDFAYPLIS